MTRQQARLLKPFIPAGYIALVEERLRAQQLEVPSQPFISNVKHGRKQHAAIEAILLDLVRQERERRDQQAASIQNAITA